MKILRGLALVMVMAASVYAGDIQNPAPPPPPNQNYAIKVPNGGIPRSFTSNEVTMRATVVQVILEALLFLY
ncbi:MAG TPA: hypothetical protein VGN86_17980 [Pyrinomonadaceae bacterium]|jgi:hypothetical protein|nr:hypothetical protein [Pyrinomonadaceae bacterium]